MTNEEIGFVMSLSRGMVDEDFCDDYKLFLDLAEKHDPIELMPKYKVSYVDKNDKYMGFNFELKFPKALEEFISILEKKYDNEILATAYMLSILEKFNREG